MLIGHRPFSAPTVHELLDKQLREPAPPIALLRTDIPPRLARLIDSALSKDPVERPVSMESIASTLRARSTAERPPRPISVLIAEDDAPIARVLEEFVVDLAPDAHVRVARDGEAALAHVRQAQPDLLLLDIGLPTMNGIELCMHLRGGELARNTSIVAMSAAAQPRDLAILKQLGIKSFIRKGGDWLARVEDAVTSARAPRSVAPV
jgi:CheY-like chemotaxis protein